MKVMSSSKHFIRFKENLEQYTGQINDYQSPTFEQNMTALLVIKDELSAIHQMYAPNSTNFAQIQQIQTLKNQVLQSRQKITGFQQVIQNAQKKQIQQRQVLAREKQDLLQMNERLVKSTDDLAKKLSYLDQEKEKLRVQLEGLESERQAASKKYKKELENLKLMHAQEIYILRKKLEKEKK